MVLKRRRLARERIDLAPSFMAFMTEAFAHEADNEQPAWLGNRYRRDESEHAIAHVLTQHLSMARVVVAVDTNATRLLEQATVPAPLMLSLLGTGARWRINSRVMKRARAMKVVQPVLVKSQPFRTPYFPLPSESVDLVVCRHIETNLREVYRVLRPGGRLILTYYGGEHLMDLFEAMRWPRMRNAPTLENGQNKVSLRNMTAIYAYENRPMLTFEDIGAVIHFIRVRYPYRHIGRTTEFVRQGLYGLHCQIESRVNPLRLWEHYYVIVAEKRLKPPPPQPDPRTGYPRRGRSFR